LIVDIEDGIILEMDGVYILLLFLLQL